jgi:hypothetical protein
MKKITIMTLSAVAILTLAACGTPTEPVADTTTDMPTAIDTAIESDTQTKITTEVAMTIQGDTATSILTWEASKKLIANYYHKGTVEFNDISIGINENGSRKTIDATIDMSTLAYVE